MSDLYLVFKNLTRKPLRFFLTVFSIFIAFMIYGTLTAFETAFNAGVELSADDRLVSVNKINFTQPLPISYVRRVQAVEGIEAVVHMNWFGGYYQDPQKQVLTFAVDQENLMNVYGDDLVIEQEQLESWTRNRQGVLVGRAVADLHGWKLGDRIPLNSNIFSQHDGSTVWQFDIEGIYTGHDPQVDTNSVYIHYEYFNETQSFGGDMIGWMGIKTEDPKLNEQVIKEIDDMFANSPFETETVPEKVFNKGFLEQLGNISLIIGSVVFMAFFIILVIVGFSMVLSIRERTGEIGVMKTLGFQSSRIFKMVLMESMLLVFIGGLLGLWVATGILGFLNNLPQFPVPDIILKPNLLMQAVGIMVFLGFVTGIIPAVNALRLNIITALSRH
ncbi:ABC transporter permease [Kordiimonas sp.]|uniref:ABC transporter permease n=1 Tax=Kordiimonas sp. TaxID=1970157 RepID=UPI003A8DA69C